MDRVGDRWNLSDMGVQVSLCCLFSANYMPMKIINTVIEIKEPERNQTI